MSIRFEFLTLNDDDKLSFILCNVAMARLSGKICNDFFKYSFILSMLIMCSSHKIDTCILSKVRGVCKSVPFRSDRRDTLIIYTHFCTVGRVSRFSLT